MELENKQRTLKACECTPQGALAFQDLPVNMFKEKSLIKFSMMALKSKGHWKECSMICYPKVQSKVIKKELHADLIEKVGLEKDKRKDLEEE